jgi:hypothetical protein
MIGGLFAGELSESEAALRVYLAAGGLVLLGALLLTLTVRWWRATRPEPPLLAPLEVMGERKWAKAPEPEKQRLLEQYRPATADGTTPIVPPEPVDLAALARVPPRDFDDLVDDGASLGEVRVVGPLVVGGVALDPNASVVGPVDETVALVSGVEFDATSALIAPDVDHLDELDDVDELDHLDELDDVDDADDFERDVDAVDTGETLTVDESADDESPAPVPVGDDTRDVVQQALSLESDDLVEHGTARD